MLYIKSKKGYYYKKYKNGKKERISKKIEPPPKEHSKTLPLVKDVFREKQEGAGCGRHALNNLLGNIYFIRGVFERDRFDITLEFNKICPIPLNEFCKSLPLFASGGCQSHENYDINVIQLALILYNYDCNILQGDLIEKINKLELESNFIGFICNLNGGHYLAIKYYANNIYYIINSWGDIEQKNKDYIIQNYGTGNNKLIYFQNYK